MIELSQEIPDVDFLLGLHPEELGTKMLFLLRKRKERNQFQNGMFHIGNLESELQRTQTANGWTEAYPGRGPEVGLAVAEAWAWLGAQGFIVPAEGVNGINGWRRLGRVASRFEDETQFVQYAIARRLPKAALHPRIANKVWAAFMRGDFDVAVLLAMKAVEVAVREAAKLSAKDIGTNLMRMAFDPQSGPLTDMTSEKAEREARSALFAGAIGSYKNPHSHRDVPLDNAEEATEVILLANHLLRIVDSRCNAMPS